MEIRQDTAALQPCGAGSIDPTRLMREQYTNSLVAEGVRTGQISEDAVVRLQGGFMDMLATVIGYVTGGESTSVRMDAANGYLGCITYNCDTYLLSLGDPEAALAMLRDVRVEELYNRGYAINRRYLQEARRLLPNVQYTRFPDGSNVYKHALDVQIPQYLSTYDPRFNAQDKLYVSIPSQNIRGPFHIDETVKMLKTLLAAQKGRYSDVEL